MTPSSVFWLSDFPLQREDKLWNVVSNLLYLPLLCANATWAGVLVVGMQASGPHDWVSLKDSGEVEGSVTVSGDHTHALRPPHQLRVTGGSGPPGDTRGLHLL